MINNSSRDFGDNTGDGGGGSGVGGGGDQKSYGSSLDGMEQPQVIEVSPDQLPVQVHFRTASSRLNVQQSHGGQAMPQVEHASFQVLFFPFFSILLAYGVHHHNFFSGQSSLVVFN